MDQQETTNQIPLPEDNHEVLPEVKEKEQQIEKSKKIVNIIKLIILGLIGLLVITGIVVSIVINIQNRNKETPQTKEEPIEVINPNEVTWENYTNTELKLNIKYPNNTNILEDKKYDGTLNNIEIIYTTNGNNTSTYTEGFSVKITPLELTITNLDEISSIKRESFYNECSGNVSVSSVRADIVDNIEARTFEVKNCNGDFKVTYISKFGKIYEIIQLYRGDLGFRQQYQSTTEEMVQSIEFYPEEEKEKEPFESFDGTRYGIGFTYPTQLSLNCCEVPSPRDRARLIVNLGMRETEEKYGALGIYYIDTQTFERGISFNDFISQEKDRLISEYKVAKNGDEPTIVEEQLTIDGNFAVRYNGLSWRGNDLIYINTNNRRSYIYVISIVNNYGSELEDIVQNILQTIKITDIK